jgi:hypothetical protein
VNAALWAVLAAFLALAALSGYWATVPHGMHAAPRGGPPAGWAEQRARVWQPPVQVVGEPPVLLFPVPPPPAKAFRPRALTSADTPARLVEVTPRPYVPTPPDPDMAVLLALAGRQARGRREAETGTPWADDTGTFTAIHLGGER